MCGHHLRGRYSVRRSLRRLLASTAVGLFLALVPVEVGLGNGEMSAEIPVAPAAIGAVHPPRHESAIKPAESVTVQPN